MLPMDLRAVIRITFARMVPLLSLCKVSLMLAQLHLFAKHVCRHEECQVLKGQAPCLCAVPGCTYCLPPVMHAQHSLCHHACCRLYSLTCGGQCWKRCTSTMWRALACTQSWSSWMLLWATCVQQPMTPCMLTWPAHCCKPPLWQCSAYCWMEDLTGMGCISFCSATSTD